MIILRKPYRKQAQENGVVVADVLSAGANAGVYHTTYKYKRDRITVYYNGQALHSPYDFDQTGEDEITLIDYVFPLSDEKLRATYELEGFVYGQMLSGQQPIPIGAISQQINFGISLANNLYNVDIQLTTTDGEPSVYSYVVASKAVNGFIVYFSGVIDSSNYVIDWAVSP
jgi:hypothetical protein